jgi:hypothetical protein
MGIRSGYQANKTRHVIGEVQNGTVRICSLNAFFEQVGFKLDLTHLALMPRVCRRRNYKNPHGNH